MGWHVLIPFTANPILGEADVYYILTLTCDRFGQYKLSLAFPLCHSQSRSQPVTHLADFLSENIGHLCTVSPKHLRGHVGSPVSKLATRAICFLFSLMGKNGTLSPSKTLFKNPLFSLPNSYPHDCGVQQSQNWFSLPSKACTVIWHPIL